METTTWQAALAQGIGSLDALAERFPGGQVCLKELAPVTERYPLFINRYYLGLLQTPHDPLWRQAVPALAVAFPSGRRLRDR